MSLGTAISLVQLLVLCTGYLAVVISLSCFLLAKARHEHAEAELTRECTLAQIQINLENGARK